MHAYGVTRLLSLLLVLMQLLGALAVSAQEETAREAGVVVGTTGLNIRECPDVSCKTKGLAQLEDSITVTGPAQNGFLPVEWEGVVGWAWQLYVASPSRGTPSLEEGSPGCNRVAFIFNIGIGEPMQLQGLEWLKNAKVPATVFPMGWWALAFPDDMQAIAKLGFPIGTHGDVRLGLTGFSDDEVIADIQNSAIHIRQIIGKDPEPYFTPFAADIDDRVRELVAREGYLPVSWDVPAGDWDAGITPEYVYDRVMPNIVDGSIVEFHLDGPSSAESTVVALPWIVRDLRAKGYHFVTIPDMAQPCGAATPVPVASPVATPTST
jgi:peptidoglycan/xylan/chitin deacetylase (PgdA/CDA1 family)